MTLADNKGKGNTTNYVDIEPIKHFDTPSDSELKDELCTPYNLTEDHHFTFRRDGFIKLPNVLSPGAVVRLREELIRLLSKTFPESNRSNRFLSLEMMWIESPIIRQYVLSPRMAKISADLLSVKSVRLYHDQALYKSPRGGMTPWHCDQYYWPLDTDKTITAWIPLQDTPVEMGAVVFSVGSHHIPMGRNLPIGDDSQQVISDNLNRLGLEHVEQNFEAGDVSFHWGGRSKVPVPISRIDHASL